MNGNYSLYTEHTIRGKTFFTLTISLQASRLLMQIVNITEEHKSFVKITAKH